MNQGDFLGALDILVQARLKFGPQIQLICDLASCYYMLGDYENYKIWTEKAYKEYQKVKEKLSPETRQSACLALGKLLEELGQLSSALRLYQSETTPDIRNSYSDKIEASLLRLSCLIQDKDILSKNYVYCEMRNIKDGDIEIDLQLALLHADLWMEDIESGVLRVSRVLAKEDISPSDQRLLIFDLLFEALKLGKLKQFPKSFLDLHRYDELDPFEQFLFDFYQDETGAGSHMPITATRSEGHSPLGALRILFLLSQREKNEERKTLISKKIFLLLRQLDSVSRGWILKAWSLSESDIMSLDLRADELLYQSLSLKLNSSKMVLQFIQFFSKQTEVATDVLAKDLFGIELDPSIYNRLKVLVSKVNKMIETELGIQKPFSLSIEKVILRDQVKIRRAG